MQFIRQLSAEEFWAQADAMEQRVRETAQLRPCYGLVGWTGPVAVSNWQFEDERVVAVGIAHGRLDGLGPSVTVQTTTADPAAEARNLQLAAGGPPLGRDDLEDRLAELDSEPVRTLVIPVEEIPVSFNIRGDEARWIASASYQGFGLVLDGRGWVLGGLKLQRVADIEPYLRGRREQIRAMRHEG